MTPVNNGSNVNNTTEHILMTLPEASKLLFGTRSRVNTLRTAIRKGNLRPAKIAGTFFVTVKDLEEMEKSCRENQQDRISTTGNEKASNPATLSETDKRKLQRDAALKKSRKRTFNSQNTPNQNTNQNTSATVVSLVKS